jgi:hypothetical protein
MVSVLRRCRGAAVVAALAFAAPSSCARGQAAPVAGGAAEKLLRGDFDGDPDRGLRLWFSPERAKQEQARDSYGGEQLDCQGNAFVLVSRYVVVRTEEAGERATAVVAFCRVGSVSRLLSDVRPEPPHVETVTLELVRRGGEWRALDPPEPRVSVTAARGCVEELLGRATGALYERHASTSKGEQAVRERNVRAADVLAGIERARPACALEGAAPSAAQPASTQAEKARDAPPLAAELAALKAALARRDVDALAALLTPGGVECGDYLYGPAEYDVLVRKPDGKLRPWLFGAGSESDHTVPWYLESVAPSVTNDSPTHRSVLFVSSAGPSLEIGFALTKGRWLVSEGLFCE